jgi:hypothetical protein
MDTSKQFDFGTSFVFRLGKGKVIPGLDQGIVVSSVYFVPVLFACASVSVW